MDVKPGHKASLQTITDSEQGALRIREINSRLVSRYKTPDLGNVENVFGELIYAMLSTRSAPSNYRKAFLALQAAYPRWSDLANASVHDLETLIQPCGLYSRKARAVLTIAQRIFREEGLNDLEHLRALPTESVEAYLTSLPEVGFKIAKCVSLYALHRPAFPLDAHNLRVLKRLQIVEESATARESAYHVESLIPPEIRYTLHVNLVVHGREVCKALPACHHCVLRDICPYPGLQGSRSC